MPFWHLSKRGVIIADNEEEKELMTRNYVRGTIEMTELEYLCGLIVLLFGYNIGYQEATDNLTFANLKKLVRIVGSKFRK